MHSNCLQTNKYHATPPSHDSWATAPDRHSTVVPQDDLIACITICIFVALVFSITAMSVWAQDTDEPATQVNVNGLARDTAILTINGGKPRIMRIGQTRDGVKLLETHADHVIVEIDGERLELTLGDNAYTPQKSGLGNSVTLASDSSGHFVTRGTINGRSVSFLVDTGASLVSMGVADARKAGINYLEGKKGVASTANGPAPVYRVTLDSVAIGDIMLRNVDGLVHAEVDLPFVLLGMSFLQQLDMRREANILTLKKRY